MTREYFPPEKLLESSGGSIYKLTILASKRAMQLADGEKPLIEDPKERLLDNALKEIQQQKIKIKKKKK